MPPKRKRNGYINGYKVSAANLASYHRTKAPRRNGTVGMIVPGYTRRSGYYGRYNVAAQRRARAAGQPVELKFHDLDIDDATIAANGTIAEDSCLTIAEGLTESSRVGRKITVVNIGWRYKIQYTVLASAAGANSDTVRVILYLDHQANGATAAVTDLLESDDYQSFNNLANKDRFRTLSDRTYDLQPSVGAGDGAANDYSSMSISDTVFLKNLNIPINYDNSATTGVITTMRSNNIGVLLLSEIGLTSFESKMRVRYSDIG